MKKVIPWALPGLIVLILDRVVKVIWGDADAVLIPGVIRLRSAQNTGMAMGMFQGKALPILFISFILIGICVYLMRGIRPKGLAPVSLSMIAGGALGNMIDRIAFGYVIDMFDLLFMDFYIFNVADAGVVIGAILCGISLLFRPRDWSKK